MFSFKRFSRKQRQLLHWWRPGSPHIDKDVVIADGAIRSGKTIAMLCGFLTWSLSEFHDQDFILAGKTVGALKRNL
ncbi:MAG: PBSX family phage terminase large subunit, partial [Coriobacteriia bacterium]|nr:PBSX family phage terminase large subunit [Coriobacteriia bacterium]